MCGRCVMPGISPPTIKPSILAAIIISYIGSSSSRDMKNKTIEITTEIIVKTTAIQPRILISFFQAHYSCSFFTSSFISLVVGFVLWILSYPVSLYIDCASCCDNDYYCYVRIISYTKFQIKNNGVPHYVYK